MRRMHQRRQWYRYRGAALVLLTTKGILNPAAIAMDEAFTLPATWATALSGIIFTILQVLLW